MSQKQENYEVRLKRNEYRLPRMDKEGRKKA